MTDPEIATNLPNWAMLLLLIAREATFWLTRNSPNSIKGAAKSSVEKLDEVLVLLNRDDADGVKLIHAKRSDSEEIKRRLDRIHDAVMEIRERTRTIEEGYYDDRR